MARDGIVMKMYMENTADICESFLLDRGYDVRSKTFAAEKKHRCHSPFAIRNALKILGSLTGDLSDAVSEQRHNSSSHVQSSYLLHINYDFLH